MLIAFDLETELISRGRLDPPPVCMSWDDGTPHLALWRDAEPIFRRWVEDDSVTLIGANVVFDTTCASRHDTALYLAVKRKYAKGLVRDVQLDARLLDIAAGRYERAKIKGWSLAALAARRGIGMEKPAWRLRYAALRRVPVEFWPDGARKYAMTDAVETRCTHLVNEQEAETFRAQGLEVLGHHSVRVALAAETLHAAACRGVHTDAGRLAAATTLLVARQKELCLRLAPLGLIRANGTKDTKVAQARMTAACSAQDREVPRTDKGAISLDKDACILSGDEALIARAEYVTLSTELTRVRGMHTGISAPLQTRWNPLVETARTSSSKPEPPKREIADALAAGGLEAPCGEQMQNFPRGGHLRECFAPRPGNVFIGADLAQAELHALAEFTHAMGWGSELGRVLNEGADVHWYFAASSLGISIEQLKARPDSKMHRDRAKPLNFGIPGGMGVDKIILYSRKSYGVRFERDEVIELRNRWLRTFPEVRAMFGWVSTQLEHSDTFTHIHPITGFVRGGCGYTDGCNHSFQHLTAYGAKDALVQVDHVCHGDTPLHGFRIWNFVHDEILLEGPTERAAAAADELARLMSAAFNRYVPHFPTAADPVVMPYWSKSAKSERVNGVLQPWDPLKN